MLRKRFFFVLLLFFLFMCLGAGCFYPYPTKKESSSHLFIDQRNSLPKRIGVLMYGNYNVNPNAMEQLKVGLVRLGFESVELEQIRNELEFVPEIRNFIFYDFSVKFSEESRQELGKNSIFMLFIGWFGDSDDMINPKGHLAYPPLSWIILNKGAHLKAKLINTNTEKVIWSGDGYDTSWTVKSAILKATEQVLKLLEKDIKKVKMGD
jgi:hypothetical protein